MARTDQTNRSRFDYIAVFNNEDSCGNEGFGFWYDCIVRSYPRRLIRGPQQDSICLTAFSGSNAFHTPADADPTKGMSCLRFLVVTQSAP